MPASPRAQGAAPRAAARRGAGREGALLAAELASEIEWAKARMVTPDGYERRGRYRRAQPPRARRPRSPTVYRDYEREKRKRGLVDFDDLISGCADVARTRHRVRRGPTLAVPSPLRRRVPGRERRAAPAAAGLARRPQRPLRRRRPRPGDLRLRRRRRVVPGRLPPLVPARAVPRRGVRAPRQQLPVDAADRRGRRRGARSAGSASPRCTPPSPTARCPTFHEYDTAEAEATRRRPRTARRRERAPPWSRMAVLYRVNAQSALVRRGLRRARACPSASAAAAGSSTVPR